MKDWEYVKRDGKVFIDGSNKNLCIHMMSDTLVHTLPMVARHIEGPKKDWCIRVLSDMVEYAEQISLLAKAAENEA